MSCDSITYMWRGTCTQVCEQGLVVDLEDRVCYGEFSVKQLEGVQNERRKTGNRESWDIEEGGRCFSGLT